MLLLPSGERVPFFFLSKLINPGPMTYLQSIRSGGLSEDSHTSQAYKNMAPHYAWQLAELVGKQIQAVNAVVTPPSHRDDARVFVDEIIARTGAIDLSTGFSRKRNGKSC